MKVIELLNKIANGEEVPKTIIYEKDTYTYDCECRDYIGNHEKNWLFDDFSIPAIINDEVEVIEEDKEDNFTGMKYYQDGRTIYTIYTQPPFKCRDDVEIKEDKKIEYWDYDKDCTNEWNFQEIKEKLDEIIDVLNKENEK